MLSTRYVLLTAIIFNCLLSYSTVAEEHQHQHSNQQALQLNHGAKWQIDQSLHIGMVSIQQQLMVNLDAIHYDKFSQTQFLALASAFDKQLNFLFENCQLAPKADAQLHVLLAKIMQGNDLIKHAENKKSGAVMILQALEEYPKYFNDVNWQ
ncbi:hypothetical protein FGD67_11960 [Colwellia sp. M166]|uniref:hypothetical protein n=1 Tax=Colwellia sp. M166 TaxID=2583805 RepID=UPI00211F3FC9|nr:hypothetical protein [Colwellia sp. M166]UUO23863.1 hypothetical protein FGD67_11960 [Colwellia sp. M166]